MKSFSELSDLSRMEPTTISKYLIELEKEYGFVISVKPVGMRKSKNTKYKLASNLFDFYFSMIKPILSTAEFSLNKALNIILDKFPQYMGLKLEEICTNFLRENHDILGFEPLEIGKSWGKVPGKKNESFDLEIVAHDEKNLVLAECKWTGKQVGLREYNEPVQKSSWLKIRREKVRYMIFSKSGFKEELLNLRSESLSLFSIEDMVNKMLETPVQIF